MVAKHTLTLGKEERIAGKKLVDQLFCGTDSHSLSAFPVRLVFAERTRAEGEAAARILVSVPKRHFKRAVKRNRVKRQLRECYRRNKMRLLERLAADSSRQMLLAFIWLDNRLHSTATVERKVVNLLERLAERI